jgi:aspartate/methionine/tyrosine aminotransferase
MDRPIGYLRWHEAHTGGDHDLATSDQRAVGGGGDLVPSLLADLPDPPAETTLRAQLADEYGVAPENVLTAAGASHANFAAIAAALGGSESDTGAEAAGAPATGRRALVESPGYEPLVATPEWLGATVDRFERPCDDGFPLEADRVAAEVTPETDLVTVTNRHNPSGRRVDRDALADVAGAVRDRGARLLVDEVYAPYGSTACGGPFGGPTAASVDGTVVTGSLTKFFGLGGLRVGWLVADASFVERARLVLHHVPAVHEPGMALGRRALGHRDALCGRAREQCRANHDLLASFVAGREDLAGPVFEGATYTFLAHERADGDAVTEAAAERGCTVVPGRFFDRPGRFRVSLGDGPDAIADALDALGAALDEV